ncbi:MAG: GNAT family N-acetyltransferase, partial [Bacteroidota bacterium]
SELGYVPVTYNQLTDDEAFWKGCRSCTNYEILMKKEKAHCMCTAMLFDPKKKPTKRWDFVKKWKVYERFMNLKKQNLAT